ncbi:MAG TPA: hypothetical protein VIF82_17065 [Burkholderiaceae bacterium]|jgi:hypothetical protein
MLKAITYLAFTGMLFIFSFTGMTTTAYAANKKLSEEEACGLAKAEVLNRKGGEKKVELNVLGCTKFSIFEQGVANIQVLYDSSYFNAYMKTRYETKNLTDKCNFIQTSQGWKIMQCK